MHISDPLERRLNRKGTNMVVPWNPNMARRDDMRLISQEEAMRLVQEGKREADMRRSERMQEMIRESQVPNIHSKPESVMQMPIEAPPAELTLSKDADVKPLHKMTKVELFSELRDQFSFEPDESAGIVELRKMTNSFRKTGKPPVQEEEKVVV